MILLHLFPPRHPAANGTNVWNWDIKKLLGLGYNVTKWTSSLYMFRSSDNVAPRLAVRWSQNLMLTVMDGAMKSSEREKAGESTAECFFALLLLILVIFGHYYFPTQSSHNTNPYGYVCVCVCLCLFAFYYWIILLFFFYTIQKKQIERSFVWIFRYDFTVHALGVGRGGLSKWRAHQPHYYLFAYFIHFFILHTTCYLPTHTHTRARACVSYMIYNHTFPL